VATPPGSVTVPGNGGGSSEPTTPGSPGGRLRPRARRKSRTVPAVTTPPARGSAGRLSRWHDTSVSGAPRLFGGGTATGVHSSGSAKAGVLEKNPREYRAPGAWQHAPRATDSSAEKALRPRQCRALRSTAAQTARGLEPR